MLPFLATFFDYNATEETFKMCVSVACLRTKCDIHYCQARVSSCSGFCHLNYNQLLKLVPFTCRYDNMSAYELYKRCGVSRCARPFTVLVCLSVKPLCALPITHNLMQTSSVNPHFYLLVYAYLFMQGSVRAIPATHAFGRAVCTSRERLSSGHARDAVLLRPCASEW